MLKDKHRVKETRAAELITIDVQPAYLTSLGAAYCGDSLKLLAQLPDNSVNLVMTSPPFALQREKDYGNKSQEDYVGWLEKFARVVYQKPNTIST